MQTTSKLHLSLSVAVLGLAMVLPSILPQAASAATVASAYKRVSYNGYSFEVPSSWKSATVTTGALKTVVFKNTAQKEAASLVCPGFIFALEDELHPLTSRRIIANGFKYAVTKDFDTAPETTTAVRGYVQMSFDGYKTVADNTETDPGYGCLLKIESTSGLKALTNRIYASVRVEGWKSLTTGGVTMKYPAAWKVSAAMPDGKNTTRTFTDINGRETANMVCGPTLIILDSEGRYVYGERTVKNKAGQFRAFWLDAGTEVQQMESVSWLNISFMCQVTTDKEGQHGFFREIYKSLK